MKRITALFIIISAISPYLSAQIKGETYTMRISGTSVINKKTGEKLEGTALDDYMFSHPKTVFEPVINKFGDIDYFEVDPQKTDMTLKIDISKRTKNGDTFLPFIVNANNGKHIDSEKLKGMPIILQFQLHLKGFGFLEKVYNKLDSLVENYQEIGPLEAILFTETKKEELPNQFNPDSCNFNIVTDARNFKIRYQIETFPSIILIDKEGKLVSYYDSLNMNQLESDLKKLMGNN